eukprot:3189814-Karenia_brevis.AAC.1
MAKYFEEMYVDATHPFAGRCTLYGHLLLVTAPGLKNTDRLPIAKESLAATECQGHQGSQCRWSWCGC